IHAIRTHPEFLQTQISVTEDGNCTGWFDSKKLERALYNLLTNACEAVSPEHGEVVVDLREVPGGVEVRVTDNGRGIPESIRTTLFEPFVSYGKENGTGLGLTVVQKIVEDHGGDVIVERTSKEGTVFRLLLPLTSSSNGHPVTRADGTAIPMPPLARTKPAE